MLSSIKETRERGNNGIYTLNLEIPEKDFFQLYDDVGKEAAHDILSQYLIFRGDDGRPNELKIRYNGNTHMVNLYSELNYIDYDYTDYK